QRADLPLLRELRGQVLLLDADLLLRGDRREEARDDGEDDCLPRALRLQLVRRLVQLRGAQPRDVGEAVEQRDARGDPSVQALVALREEASHALVERLAVVLTYPSRDAQVRQELHLRIPDGE